LFWSLLALGLILCLAAGLRLARLGEAPPGLWFDEALNGQDALAVWQPGGHFKLVYPDVFPREPLFETLLALTVKLGGPSVALLRLDSALVGLLTIALLYFMLRCEVGEGEALAAAGMLATMRWHALFSRLVFRTITLGPWMIVLVWAALRLRRRPSAGRAIALGVMIGGGFYTYLAWYFLLPLVGAMVLWLLLSDWRRAAVRRAVALVLLTALLVFLPLGVHYYDHPDHLFARPGEVSAFAGGARAAVHEILKNAGEALLMFHWRGDHVPKHNIPHRPALDPLQGLAFLLGLGLCFYTIGSGLRNPKRVPKEIEDCLQSRRDDSPSAQHFSAGTSGINAVSPVGTTDLSRPFALTIILLGWLGCGLAATIFTKTDSPNFLRTLCITPAMAAIAGIGLAGAGRGLARRAGKSAAVALVAGLIAISGGLTSYDIYANWARRPDVWHAFHGDLSELARFARGAPPDVAVFVPQFHFEHRSFAFQTSGAKNVYPYRDWTMLAPWPPTPLQAGRAAPRRRWIIVTANNQLLEPLSRLAPGGAIRQGFQAPEGNTWAAVFAISENALPAPDAVKKMQARWRGEMRF